MTFPITTTLNRIWACDPCSQGRQFALQAAGKPGPDDEPITYAAIAESVELSDALWCMRAEPQHAREWRLFAIWCGRQAQHLMTDQRSIDALGVAERFANGEATKGELDIAWRAARHAAFAAAGHDAGDAAGAAAEAAAWDTAWYASSIAARGAARDAARATARHAAFAAAKGADKGDAWDAAWIAAWRAAGAAQRQAFIQLVNTGELP